MSWGTSQFFRVQKQVGMEKTLAGLEITILALTNHSEEQREQIRLILEAVVPERRLDPQEDLQEEVVPLLKAGYFFDEVAPVYGRRNTGKYLKTYVEIDSLIRSHKPDLANARICDIGGGTGTLLRWLMRDRVTWTNVDISLASLAIFEAQEDFKQYPLKEARHCDVRTQEFINEGEHFDVLVMCFLLSSLDPPIDFRRVTRGMNDRSLLVIADNHHEYVSQNPRYGFENVRGRNISIYPRPMFAEEIRAACRAAGLIEHAYKLVSLDDPQPYSQVLVFKKVAKD